MPTPLNIYTFVPQGYHASYYYRILLPIKTAMEIGLPVNAIIDTNIEGVNSEQRMKNFCEADVVMLYQPVGDGTLNNAKLAHGILPSKREGVWKYPPSIVMDTDDNLFNVNPQNPAFLHLGTRDPEGRDIPKGHMIALSEKGVRKVLWADGQNGFDVERNRATVETYRQIINHSDAVTCTTPRCAQYVKDNATPTRVGVFPNLMRLDHYPQIDLVPDTSQIKILWQGGQNHREDWLPLAGAVAEITKKYPQVHWIMWGVNYDEAVEAVPPHRMTFLPWCGYEEYKLRRVMIGEDISLAPLSDNLFNRCRSAIKFYEASVSKKPAATLAQNTGPYADEILDGETGLLFTTPQEFVERLSLLIEDSEQRKSLASNAQQWVHDHRDAMKEVPKQIAFFEELRETVKVERPHMSDAEWEKFEKEMQEQQKAAEEAAKAATAQ